MRDEYTRYFLGFLVAVGLIILVIFLLFRGGGDNTKKPEQTGPKPLYTYADTDAVVRMTISGQVAAPVNRVTVAITVGRDQTTYQQFQGYDGQVVNSQQFDNTRNSYEVFLRSLAGAGFYNGNTDPNMSNPDGVCPLGSTFTYEMIQDGKELINFWSTTCAAKTYKGNVNTTIRLFENQVPNYSTLTSGLAL